MRPLLKSVLENLICSKTGKPHQLPESQLIILYFSSQTCHQSSVTTEQMVAYYDRMRERYSTAVEVIFVSGDKSDEESKQHNSCMPWPCLHFARTQIRVRLCNLYRINNLPYIVFLDRKSGKVVLKGGPEILENEANRIKPPFEMKTLQTILSNCQIVDSELKKISHENLLVQGYLALYFAAKWCPPCKSFTSQLKEFYEEMKNKRDDFEILFVSSDRCETSFNQIRESMPWSSVDWEDETSRRELALSLEVKGIPALVLVDSNFKIVSSNCKPYLREDPKAEIFPWKMKNTEVLKEIYMPFILENPSIILFTDGEEEDVKLGFEVLSSVAEEYYSRELTSSLGFFIAGENEVSERLREYINIDDMVPQLLLFDLAEGIKYEFSDEVELTSTTISNFVDRYLSNELKGILLEDCGSEE